MATPIFTPLTITRPTVCRWFSLPVYKQPLLLGWSAPSLQELLVILAIALIIFGAKRLPEFARALGRSLGEFRKARDELEKEFHDGSAGEESSSRLYSQPSLDQAQGAPGPLPQRQPPGAVSPPPPSAAPSSLSMPPPKDCSTR
ncbi:MAG: twin-arginine translocase TatA/TatE family subunit [Candidatus Xiphinematobacter sp.]|nr:MAG: twin-arginine translocase TatA/TatE family subunit [Candidatus Xiphinematobacter sp.]